MFGFIVINVTLGFRTHNIIIAYYSYIFFETYNTFNACATFVGQRPTTGATGMRCERSQKHVL